MGSRKVLSLRHHVISPYLNAYDCHRNHCGSNRSLKKKSYAKRRYPAKQEVGCRRACDSCKNIALFIDHFRARFESLKKKETSTISRQQGSIMREGVKVYPVNIAN